MKISDIILEYKMGTAIDLETLQAEFDEQYGNPRLPQHINLSKSQIVALAMGIAQKTRETPGTAIRKATAQLYPKHDIDADVYIGSPKDAKKEPLDKKDKKDKEEPKKAVVPNKKSKKPDGTTTGIYEPPKLKRGWNQSTHRNKSFKGDGKGSMSKIAKKLNPISDLDSTDIGTVATSALSKASAKFRNKDLFKRQPSKRK